MEDKKKEIVEIKETGVSNLVQITALGADNSLSQMWGFDTTGFIQEVNKSASLKASKHGMFASVPIICKAQDCHYKNICTVDPSNIVLGQRCPIEIGTIIARYTQYCRHFGVNIEGDMIADEDMIDAMLIKDLVILEVQQMRCESKIAMSGDFMEETLVNIDKKCNPYYQDMVSPASEHLLALQEKKTKLLNQLNATRKDKAMDKSKMATPTESAIKIFKEMQKLSKDNVIIDIDSINFDEIEDIEEIDTMSQDKQEIQEGLLETITPEEQQYLDNLLHQQEEETDNG